MACAVERWAAAVTMARVERVMGAWAMVAGLMVMAMAADAVWVAEVKVVSEAGY